MILAHQLRVVYLTTAITRTEGLLSTLRTRMKHNRSKGCQRYKSMVNVSTLSKSQNTGGSVTASKSNELQTPEHTDMISTALIKDDKTTVTNLDKVDTGQKSTTQARVTLASILEDTYATEQILAAQVQRDNLVRRPLHDLCMI